MFKTKNKKKTAKDKSVQGLTNPPVPRIVKWHMNIFKIFTFEIVHQYMNMSNIELHSLTNK